MYSEGDIVPKRKYIVSIDGKFLDEDLPSSDPPKRRVKIKEIEAEVLIW